MLMLTTGMMHTDFMKVEAKQQLLCSEGQCWTLGTNEACQTAWFVTTDTLGQPPGPQLLYHTLRVMDQVKEQFCGESTGYAHLLDFTKVICGKDISSSCLPYEVAIFLEVPQEIFSSLPLVSVSFLPFSGPAALGDFGATSRLERNDFL